MKMNLSNIDEDDIRRITDQESAVEILEAREVENASELVESYISSIPDLLEWFEKEGRDYKWREERDAWKTLLVEILLQRTRADAVAEVYPDIIQSYPDPQSLHRADQNELREKVETLGFVNHRVKSLKDISKIIVEENQGKVPKNIEELQQGWRIGEYVSRAVQIFARGKPTALVDSNIARVIGRVFNMEMPSQPHKDEQIHALMEALTPKNPEITRNYYFALIDLGALVCTPENPDHEACPLQDCCEYYNE